jgi:hypothetical protein
MLPPTNKFLATPTPPDTIRAPVVVVVDCVVSLTVDIPVALTCLKVTSDPLKSVAVRIPDTVKLPLIVCSLSAETIASATLKSSKTWNSRA